MRSGGGGYGSTAKNVLLGAAAGSALTIAAGYFLYGGRHSSPYCRGNDEDRFASGNCPRGTSSQNHLCKTQIPLCPIPELVRRQWNLGPDALPKVDVLFDHSICSLVPLPTASPSLVNSANITSQEKPPKPSKEAKLIEGDSRLDECVQRIVEAGGCGSYSAGSMFQFDEDSGTCGCCSSPQITTLDENAFQSAVYSLREADDYGGVAPGFCISGSTLFYPTEGGDSAHACECGRCGECGAGEPRYMDWSGPFVVPNGNEMFLDQAMSQPLYDPVDTCICDDRSASQCESDLAPNLASGAFSPNVASPDLVFVSTVLLYFLHLVF